MGIQGFSTRLTMDVWVFASLALAIFITPAVCIAAEVSTVPTTDQAAVKLGTFYVNRLSWYHTCPGDYNQDGMVTAADITPFGMNFDIAVSGDDESFPDWNVLSVIDGNGDGLITSADITPIGVHYGMDVLGGYQLYASDDARDYPDSNAGPNKPGATLIASRGFAETVTKPGDTSDYNGRMNPARLRYEVIVDDPTVYEYWWVRPLDKSGHEGTPSELWRNPGKAVPVSDDDRALASWNGGTNMLSWYYNHLGDYSLNGFIDTSEVTIIGMHLGEVNTGDPNSIAYIIDNNGSGDVDQGDLDTVLENWGTIIYGYNVYVSNSANDYPSANDAGSVLEQVAAVDYINAGFRFSEVRPLLSIALAEVTPGMYLWVRPYDSYGYEGTPSNLVVVE